jgi:hypothetical protein
MLSFNNFLPQTDEQLRRQAALFSQKHRMKATNDTIAGPPIPQKLAAEVEIYAVHDVVVLPHSSPYLYPHQLVTVDPLAEELGKRDEGWHDFCRDHSCVDGAWKVVGCWNSSGRKLMKPAYPPAFVRLPPRTNLPALSRFLARPQLLTRA